MASLVHGLHYTTDEYQRDVELTDAGLDRLERALGCGPLHDPGNEPLLAEVNCALHAEVLLHRDADYIVKDGRIGIVDEFTGRVIRDRHWPDGLQAALEAKEGLERQDDGHVLASVTLQRYLRGYERLCGMTGTARAAAAELRSFYGLEVVAIPTHRPVQRIDQPDLVFTHRSAKETAVADEVERTHAAGRPVLVGTLTVEESERIGTALRARGVSCQVLNAREDEDEARIVASAGAPGAVTIATNMAGRGTDIRLGDGTPESAARVAALGGLYVIGTNRHESRRIDLQLRGRAGRQGDPGESRFFISLDDDLLVRYGIRRLIPARHVPAPRLEPIDHPVVRREIARAQRIVEGQNFEIRRTLARYAAVVEDQYALVVERRAALVSGDEPPATWAGDHAARARLAAVAGEDATDAAERAVTRAHLDRLLAGAPRALRRPARGDSSGPDRRAGPAGALHPRDAGGLCPAGRGARRRGAGVAAGRASGAGRCIELRRHRREGAVGDVDLSRQRRSLPRSGDAVAPRHRRQGRGDLRPPFR